MSGPRSRSLRSLLRICVVVGLVATAGCQSIGGSQPPDPTEWTASTTATPDTTTVPTTATTTSPTTTTTTPRTTTRTVVPQAEAPAPPDELTNEAAKQAALDYEEAYVTHVLRPRNYSEWGVGAWDHKTATVVDRTDDGIYVRVEMPYSYQHGGGYVDTYSRATYFVNTETVHRVNGSEISPLPP